jgi:1-acyl-sn-glycerol-3-phosphate acyltransferase
MKKPNLVVWLTLGAIAKVYAYFLGLRFLQKEKIKGPAIVLANHNSFKDFFFSTAAVYPRRVTYLAAAKMFHESHRRPFLKLARAIPKAMFQSDPASIKATFQILKQKGIIGIYPEGQISYHGTSLPSPFAIAKLLKKTNVPVYICQIQNAYLFAPPWSKKIFKGKVYVRFYKALTPNQLEKMNEEEIYQTISQQLHFNTGEFNRQHEHTYQVQPIKGLEPLLYQCPACLYEGLNAVNQTLVCPQCKHTLTYDKFGFLNGKSVYEWFELQRARLEAVIQKTKDYTLSIPVRLVRYQGKGLGCVGDGIFTVTKDACIYEGTDQGEIKRYVYTIKTVPYLPADLGLNIQIYYDNEVFIFEMDLPLMSTKMFIAGEYFHQLANRQSSPPHI